MAMNSQLALSLLSVAACSLAITATRSPQSPRETLSAWTIQEHLQPTVRFRAQRVSSSGGDDIEQGETHGFLSRQPSQAPAAPAATQSLPVPAKQSLPMPSAPSAAMTASRQRLRVEMIATEQHTTSSVSLTPDHLKALVLVLTPFLVFFSSLAISVYFHRVPLKVNHLGGSREKKAVSMSLNAVPMPTPQSTRLGSIHKPSQTRDSETSSVSSEPTIIREEDPSCCTVTTAFLVYLPCQIIAATICLFLFFIPQQVIALPLRVCGGRPLTYLLQLGGPLAVPVSCAFTILMAGETNYGRVTETFSTQDDFLKTNSAAKRTNMKRNYKAAVKELEHHELSVSFHPAGTWRITSEIRNLFWQGCKRHYEAGNRACGYADIINFGQPLSPFWMYVAALVLLLCLPNDIQMFRTKDGKLVSLNTRAHIGNCYLNPSYHTLDEYSRVGLYSWTNWHIMHEAIRLRASTVNVMSSMRSAKRGVGLRSISLLDTVRAACSCTRGPPQHEDAPEGRAAGAALRLARGSQSSGGKRSARKRAGLSCGQSSNEPRSCCEAEQLQRSAKDGALVCLKENQRGDDLTPSTQTSADEQGSGSQDSLQSEKAQLSPTPTGPHTARKNQGEHLLKKRRPSDERTTAHP